MEQLKIELKQELKFGNQNKILKKQHKLDKAEKELKEAKDRLNS